MKLSVACVAIFLAFGAAAAADKAVSDTELGIRKVSVFDEAGLKIQDINYTSAGPGESTRLPRSFENAPPFIPHDTEGLLPITKDNNMCVSCHMPEFAADSGATAIPASHLFDFRQNQDLKGALDESRFNCTTCHVPQAKTSVEIKNSFKPEFRNKESNFKSNLLDVLNEGVK